MLLQVLVGQLDQVVLVLIEMIRIGDHVRIRPTYLDRLVGAGLRAKPCRLPGRRRTEPTLSPSAGWNLNEATAHRA